MFVEEMRVNSDVSARVGLAGVVVACAAAVVIKTMVSYGMI